jgi:acetolactate synthase I/III small subunit
MPARHQHVLVALVENRPGVLARVSGLFRRRGFNIDSLAVGRTENPDVSRMTIVVDGNTTAVEQVVKQLYKVIEVLKISELGDDPCVMAELALIKITATTATRSEVIQLTDVYHGKIVDVATDSVIVELTGPEDDIEAFVRLVRPFGIKEMVRTGSVGMGRGSTYPRIEPLEQVS